MMNNEIEFIFEKNIIDCEEKEIAFDIKEREGYDFVLMSNMPPEKKQFCIAFQEGKLQYKVISPQEEIVEDTITEKELQVEAAIVEQKIKTQLRFSPSLLDDDLSQLRPFMNCILRITSKRGHTITDKKQKEIEIMKRLATDNRMTEAYRILDKFENLCQLESKGFLRMLIDIYPLLCIGIIEHGNTIHPVSVKKYKRKILKIANAESTSSQSSAELKKAGITNIDFGDDTCEGKKTSSAKSLLAQKAAKNKPRYPIGDGVLTRQIIHFHPHYLIISLRAYLMGLFGRPFYEVIAITANVVFDAQKYTGWRDFIPGEGCAELKGG